LGIDSSSLQLLVAQIWSFSKMCPTAHASLAWRFWPDA
jgi:hypothetical protein